MNSNRYLVEADLANGNYVKVYEGNNRNQAVTTCNFWDERVNVRFTDRVMEKLIAEQEAERQEAAFRALPVDQQFVQVMERIQGQIDQSALEATVRVESMFA